MKEETRENKFQTLSNTIITEENIIPENENNEEQIKEKKQKKKNNIKKIIILSIISVFLIILSWANFIEPKLLKVNEYKIETSLIPDSFHGLKIIHFSDIHYGTTISKKELEKIIDKINETNPDIIFFTGDLIDLNYKANDDDVNDIINEFNKLNPTLYKYAIYGDEDIDNKYYKNIMEQTSFKILDNENTLLYYQDTTPIEITGFNIINNKPNYSILSDNIDDINTNNYYKIVLVHEPDSIDQFIDYNVNLILAGDTLGGLIKLPLFKPMFLNEYSKKYYNPYYNIKDTDIFISNGLGTSEINSRFNNKPSINLYRLYKTKE